LSFDANDIIIVLDADTESDWWKGETDGRTGLFPRTYCEEILDLEDPISTKYISSKSSQNPLDSFNLTSQRATSNITRGPDSEVTNEPGVVIDASTLNPKETPISSRHVCSRWLGFYSLKSASAWLSGSCPSTYNPSHKSQTFKHPGGKHSNCRIL